MKIQIISIIVMRMVVLSGKDQRILMGGRVGGEGGEGGQQRIKKANSKARATTRILSLCSSSGKKEHTKHKTYQNKTSQCFK